MDADPDTCSFSPRSSEQHWWQVTLAETFTIQSVAVSLTPETEQAYTIFVIGMKGNSINVQVKQFFKFIYISCRSGFIEQDEFHEVRII